MTVRLAFLFLTLLILSQGSPTPVDVDIDPPQSFTSSTNIPTDEQPVSPVIANLIL